MTSVEQLAVDASKATAIKSSTWRRLARDPQAIVAGAIILTGLVIAVIAPWVSPYDPNAADLNLARAPIGTPGHPLGADTSGRDMLSRLMASTTTAYVAGLIGVTVAGIIGVAFGLIGGYFGPRLRASTEALFNLIMTFPGVLLLLVLMPVTGGDYRVTMVIFGFLLSPTVYRIVRNLVAGTRNELYVDAARVSGLNDTRILTRHILFVIRGPIVIALAFLFGAAVGVQSGLAFLGIGSTQIPSFGSMMAEGFTNLTRSPMNFVLPAACLGIITASFVLFGNSLRDAFGAPKQRAVRRPKVAMAPSASSLAPVSDALLSVVGLAVAYPGPDGTLREVVLDVDLELRSGQILGLVGESGSGKTQTAFSILGVLPPEAQITRGSIRLNGRELIGLSEKEMRPLRGREVSYIPQEPMSNLDPSYTVGAQLVEGITVTLGISKREARVRVLALLSRVGIPDPERTFRSYPHEISGGMAQRVLIAGAVAAKPKLLIADEPTTALDVTVQAEILDLLRDLQEETGMAVLLVTHNFGVVADLCDRIAVMKTGRIVETGDVNDVFDHPNDPYTKMLLDSILDDGDAREDGPLAAGTSTDTSR